MPANTKANYPAAAKGLEAGGLERDPTVELQHTSAAPVPVFEAHSNGPGDQWVTREEVRVPVARVGWTMPTSYVMADNQVPGHHDVISRVPVPHLGAAGAFGETAPRINRALPDRPWDYGTQVGGETTGARSLAPPEVPDRDKRGWAW